LRACNQHLGKTGATCMWARVYLGSPTATADANLMSWSGGQWTTNHKGTNICYAIVRYDYDEDAFPGGEPDLVFVLKGAHCYDDRYDGSKAGRTGTQRLATPSTWTWTENAGVITAQVLRGFFSLGVLMYGAACEERDLSDPLLLSAYNTCDEVVTLENTTTEARYRAGLMLTSTDATGIVLSDLESAIDGQIIDRGGSITILPGAIRTPVFNLTDADIKWSQEKSWQPIATLSNLTNYVTGSCVDGANGFIELPLPPRVNSTWEANDGHERFTLQLGMKAVFSPTQGQRIMKRNHESSRFQGTAAFIGPLWMIELEQGDWFTMTSSRWGFTSKYFQTVTADLSADMSVASGLEPSCRRSSAHRNCCRSL
jgi:hypothetical protein